MDHPEGAGSQRADRVNFDRRVRLQFRGAQISSDGGPLVMRELDEALGLSGLASVALHAPPPPPPRQKTLVQQARFTRYSNQQARHLENVGCLRDHSVLLFCSS
jgi:hypothetical protein